MGCGGESSVGTVLSTAAVCVKNRIGSSVGGTKPSAGSGVTNEVAEGAPRGGIEVRFTIVGATESPADWKHPVNARIKVILISQTICLCCRANRMLNSYREIVISIPRSA